MANVATRIQFVDPQMFEEILADISAGTATYKVLEQRNIRREAFYSVLWQSAEASDKYARAKADGLERLADEIVELSDEQRIGEVVRESAKDGITITRADVLEHRKLQVDSRKWLLSKLAPKRYGDLLHLQHSGSIDLATELEAARKRAKADEKSG